MVRARRAIREPLTPRVVRRLPQLAAGLAALALLGTAVGAEATIATEPPALVAVPAARVAPAVEVPAVVVPEDSLSVAEVRRAAQEKAAAEKEAAEAEAAEKKAAEEKAAEKKAVEKKAEEQQAADAEKKAAEEAEAQAEQEAEEAATAREERTSRSSDRAPLDASQLGSGAGKRWTTVALNARSAPDAGAALLDVLDAGDELTITDRTSGTWRQVDLGGKAAWVAAEYLVDEQPKAPAASAGGGGGGGGAQTGVASGECASGSSVESGLQPNAVAVHRAICHAFPSITSYGGVRADSVPGHPDGRAVDAMIPNYSGSGNALGWQVAEYVRANASRLGVTEVIFDQKIWTTQRSGEGWRAMSNRGGDTANHRDHVHVTTR